MEVSCRSCVRLLSSHRIITKGLPFVLKAQSQLLRQNQWLAGTADLKCSIISLSRLFHTGDPARNINSLPSEESFFKRILRKFGSLEYKESKLRFGGFLLYEKCADGVDYNKIMQYLNLPDTYNTWFLITELHIWMCMVRVMSEGPEGKVVRNEMLRTLWKDAAKRAQKIGGLSGSERKDQMLDLNEQFMATLFLYDEGLQSSDKILAAALWRRLLERNCEDAHILETIVHYVRKQTLHLEKNSREDVLIKGNISWIPITELG